MEVLGFFLHLIKKKALWNLKKIINGVNATQIPAGKSPAKSTGCRTERLHCSLTKKKDKACIVLATNRNLVLLSKLLLSLQWKMLSLHTLMILKLIPPCCTLHDDFPTTLTPIFFLRNSSELRGKRCTVLKCFKFPLFLLFLM